MAGTVIAAAPAIVSASTAGPSDYCAGSAGSPYGNTHCGATVVINEVGTPTVTPLGVTLDGQDDTLVGVFNSSDQSITTLQLAGNPNLFSFDNDGLGYSWGGISLASSSPTDGTSGTVTFPGAGLAPNQTASFVLEGAPTSSTTLAEAPIAATGVTPFSTTEGQGLTQPVATFTEDAGATLGEFVATINWGDSPTPIKETGVITGPVSGVFTVSGSGTHAYAKPGVNPVSVTITDTDSGDTGVATTTVTSTEATITPSAVQNTAVEGVPLNGITVGSFTDLNPLATALDFQATITWGDTLVPTSTTGTVSGLTGGPFTVTGSYDYANASPSGTPYPVTVSVTDIDSATTFTINSSEAVAERGITVSGVTFNPLQKGAPGFSGTVATITDPNPLAVSDYTATINWGDGTATSIGTITGPIGGPFTVSGSHTWTNAGSYPVTVTIGDPDTATNSGTATSTITVFDIATPCTGSCSSTDTGTGFASVVNATGTGTVYVGIFGSVTCANDPYHHAANTTQLTATPGLTGNIIVKLRISPKAAMDLDPSHFGICYGNASHPFVDIHGVTVQPVAPGQPGGTGLLPSCLKTRGVAPCVVLKYETLAEGVVEIFIIPSGDPGWR